MTHKPQKPSDEPMDERIIIPMPKALVEEISEFRFSNRIESKSEAVRQLIRAGLEAARKSHKK